MPLARLTPWNKIMKPGPLLLNGSFSTRSTTLLSRDLNSDNAPGMLADSPRYKRLRKQQEGLQGLQSMASPANLRKQGAMRKIAYLKQRLDVLKATLLYATPAMAKTLAQEIRSIAGELASIAKILGGGSGGSSASATGAPTARTAESSDAPAATPAAATPAAAAGSDDATTENAAAEAAQAAQAAGSAAQESATAPDKRAGTASSNDSDWPVTAQETNASRGANDLKNGDDKALKAALLGARKRLKEVVSLLKSRLNPTDRMTKRELQAIERILGELDSALAGALPQNASRPATDETSTYSMAGELSAAPALSGAAVDTAA
jgi:hypothetical protein